MINIAGRRETLRAGVRHDARGRGAAARQAGRRSRTRDLHRHARHGAVRPDRDRAAPAFADVLEGVAIEEPRVPGRRRIVPAAESLLAPRRARRRLARLQRRQGAPRRDHRQGRQGGDGRHAAVQRTRSSPSVATASTRPCWARAPPNPLVDESGHGTGESANIFAAAPDVELLPVKTSTRRCARQHRPRAFNAAVGAQPGHHHEQLGPQQPVSAR